MHAERPEGVAMDEARRPIIGVAPLVDERRDSYWMLPLADDAGVLARYRGLRRAALYRGA